MANTSSYFPIRMLDRNAPDGILFGPSNFKNEADWLYPDRILKLNSTIIWCPEQKKTIGIGSYADAVKSNDEEALKKLDELGIPRNLLPKFGFTVSDDFSSTYTLKKSKASRKPKKPSVTILPAKFKGTFDDGNGDFKVGDIIKIHMRAEFVSDKHGVKKFRNLYFKPTIEELEAYKREHAAS